MPVPAVRARCQAALQLLHSAFTLWQSDSRQPCGGCCHPETPSATAADSLGLGSGSWDDFDAMFGGAASGTLPDAGPLSAAADFQQQPQDAYPSQRECCTLRFKDQTYASPRHET